MLQPDVPIDHPFKGAYVKLLAKFNVMLVLMFGLGLLLISILSERFLFQNARAQTLQQAELMISSARSTRDYTEEELTPLLDKTPDHDVRFIPQSIPFYAATVRMTGRQT
jgi:hypothetical protein